MKSQTKKNIWIPVVTGFIRKGNEILLGKRPEGDTLAGCWEFPGGKVNPNESPTEALARELDEELGIKAEIGAIRHAHTHCFGTRSIFIVFFDVHFWKGEPKPLFHSALKWAKPDELKTLEIPLPNKIILPTLLEILKVK